MLLGQNHRKCRCNVTAGFQTISRTQLQIALSAVGYGVTLQAINSVGREAETEQAANTKFVKAGVLLLTSSVFSALLSWFRVRPFS